MKKLCALFLALVMAMSLTIVPAFASADSVPNDAPPASPTTELETWSVPDWASDLEKSVKPYGGSFLYWGQLSLDPTPEIVYDTGLDAVFLSYKLDAACKLAECLSHYRNVFRLQTNLDWLVKYNDIDVAIWAKPDWREQSIGSQLSNATVAKLKDGNYDAYEAMQIIQASSEYLAVPNLNEQVRYHLSGMHYYTEDIVDGLHKLGIWDIAHENPLPADVIALAQKVLDENPELQVLGEVYELARSGKTSNYLATFQVIGSERCEELWEQISNLPNNFLLDECRWLDGYRVAIPLPAAQYHGPIEKPYPINSPELPTTATGN